MKEFIHYLRMMFSAKKYRYENDQQECYYQWYKYLVKYQIDRFFSMFKLFKKRDIYNDEQFPF